MNAAAGRELFRTLTNEQNTTVLPSTPSGTGGQGVDTYLQMGLEEFSRQVGGYKIEDDTVTVTVSGVIALPTDWLDVLAVWITSSSAMLKRTTHEELLGAKRNWLTETSATPEEYVVKGDELLIFKKPTGNVGLTVRYVASPTDFASNGFDQIAVQDHMLPVLYGAALFIQLHNDVPEMQTRATNLLKLFYAGCEAAKPFYDRKRMPGRKAP
jgi:hypothetical protein